jgi:predicted amidophosphoribosyltransferase
MPILAELIAVLAPPACAACRAPLDDAAALVCGPCLRGLPWLRTGGCRRCGLPSHAGRACPAAAAAFATAWAPLAYAGPARDLVHALKFRSALPLTRLMSAQIAANAPPWALGRASAVVPVPAAPARRRRRGFDPGELLAAQVADRLGLPAVGSLRRRGRAPRQLGARRGERRAAGRLSIGVGGPVPRFALLVDDVHTTGATLDACARVLRAAGAERVHAVTYARAL